MEQLVLKMFFDQYFKWKTLMINDFQCYQFTEFYKFNHSTLDDIVHRIIHHDLPELLLRSTVSENFLFFFFIFCENRFFISKY